MRVRVRARARARLRLRLGLRLRLRLRVRLRLRLGLRLRLRLRVIFTAGSFTPRALSGTSTALSTRSASARVSTRTPRAFATSSPLGGAMPSKKPLPTAISA